MDQAEVFFQCPIANNSLKDIIESHKVSRTNTYKKYRIGLFVIIILLFINQLLNSIYRYDLSVGDAIVMYFSDVRWLMLDSFVIICMYKVVEITCCAKYMITSYKRNKIIKDSSCYISFYESHYIIIFPLNPQIYYEYILYYSDIDKCLITHNLIVINSSIPGFITPIIRKDSFQNVQDFIRFINIKTQNKLQA